MLKKVDMNIIIFILLLFCLNNCLRNQCLQLPSDHYYHIQDATNMGTVTSTTGYSTPGS